MKAFVVALLLSAPVMAQDYGNATESGSYGTLGGTTYGPGGYTATEVLGTTIYSDGSSRTEVGEVSGSTYYSDGSSSFEMGGVTYDSSGAACTDYGCEVE